MSLQLLQNKSTIYPKKGHQIDQYTGSIHPETKRRHGKGTYIYNNKYFSYQGEYIHGKKHGPGVLSLNNGTQIHAYFIDNQIQGSGKIIYPDGSLYTGDFHLGQKHGKGIYKSNFQKYTGDYIENRKQGLGVYQQFSTQRKYQGEFKNDKYYGRGTLKAYNYNYDGEWVQGKKQGQGIQTSNWSRVSQQQNDSTKYKQKQEPYNKQLNYDRYIYKGNFQYDKFHGLGTFTSISSKYQYQGEFIQGLPKNYPNQFRVFISSNVKNQTGQINESEKVFIDLNNNPILQYEIGGDAKNIYIECVYQGAEYLDEKQPTQQQIQELIKNWQNENKKNKNPPPMPDFRAPKMKKPELLLITQETGRQIQLSILKQTNQKLKIDYRQQIKLKRQQNQKILEQLKKTQDEDPKKKGGKKDLKTDNQLKVNLFKQKATLKEQTLKINTLKGLCCVNKFELPDDFVLGNPIKDFGIMRPARLELSVKSKQAIIKKK